MAVKSSGSLSFNTDIVGEFGGSVPHSFSEYILSMALWFRMHPNNNVPTSNSNISMSGFYGSVKGVYMTYEIIGAGGGGGAGDGSPGLGGTVKRLLFASTTQGQAAISK